MEIDRHLSRLTRRMGRRPGTRFAVEMLRRHFSRRYALRPDRWTELTDFDTDLRFRVDRSAYMGSLIYWWGFHAVDELRALERVLHPEMVAVDVGANQGEFTLFLAKRLRKGRVLAFEPVAALYDQLVQNIRLNGLDNVDALNVGLADVEQTRALFSTGEINRYHSYNEGLATLFADPAGSVEVGRNRFEVFDEHHACSLRRLDLMKIDVEGAELFVLQGASESLAKFRPMVLLEINADACRAAGYEPGDLLEFLDRAGYRSFTVETKGELRPVSAGRLPPFCNVLSRPE